MPATPTALKLDIIMPSLEDAELVALRDLCEAKIEVFPTFCAWILDLVVEEIDRRGDPSCEPRMHEIPEKWTSDQFAEVLLASYTFARWPLPPGIAKLIDNIDRHIVAEASAIISHFPSIR